MTATVKQNNFSGQSRTIQSFCASQEQRQLLSNTPKKVKKRMEITPVIVVVIITVVIGLLHYIYECGMLATLFGLAFWAVVVLGYIDDNSKDC